MYCFLSVNYSNFLSGQNYVNITKSFFMVLNVSPKIFYQFILQTMNFYLITKFGTKLIDQRSRVNILNEDSEFRTKQILLKFHKKIAFHAKSCIYPIHSFKMSCREITLVSYVILSVYYHANLYIFLNKPSFGFLFKFYKV